MKRALWVLSENKWQLLTWTVKTNKTLLVSGLRNMLVLHLWTSWDSSCGYRLLPLELMYQQVPSVIKDTHFMLHLSYYTVIFGTRRVSSDGTAVTQIKKQLQVRADLIFTATIIRSFSQVSLLTWSSVGTYKEHLTVGSHRHAFQNGCLYHLLLKFTKGVLHSN